ncbi:MAG TPA: N-acetylglutaminylglutamine amidotransferase [Microthrixaceae bacterium]|nr:N-acetylglutaminylglutamine amidotransferase [Microthrixaceae bacterium]
MCGFAGEVAAPGREPDTAAVARMSNQLSPRGPDGAGSWSQGRVALGHRRLKVIDLSDHAAQPMVDPHLGLTIVFNGCIYNYEALRAELEAQGHRFFSHGDTEVILKGWREWGEGVIDRLQGMFAFALVDRDRDEVTLVRDRLGIKPLYLHERGGRLRFASSLPALLRGGGVGTEIDPVALHHYLTFHSVVPAPRTILAEVRKLPPATILRIEADGTRHERRYWDLDFDAAPPRDGMSARDWSDAVLAALRTAVDRRRVADVPVGVLLSGGVDSSLITALLAEGGQQDLQTFSIGFESHGTIEGDEFKYSDVIAQAFGTDHHQIRIPSVDLPAALEEAIAAMSEPMVSHDVVAFHLLSREVAKHVKVVQSGQGADEVFAGYRWYPPLAAVDGLGVDEYARVFFDRDHAGVAALVEPAHLVDEDVSRRFVEEHFSRPGASTAVDRALRLDTQVMLVEDPVKRVDNMTMAHGLEARVPFLDHELVELAAACPPELKLAQDGKGVLKEAARSVLPHEVIDRPKGYFPVPALSHLEGPVLDMVGDVLRSPRAKERGLFRTEAVDALLADPNGSLTPLRGNPLWQVALLELWLQEHGA